MSQNVRKKPVKRQETYYEDETYEDEDYDDGSYPYGSDEDEEEEWEEVVIRRPKKKAPAGGVPGRAAGAAGNGAAKSSRAAGAGKASGSRSAGAAKKSGSRSVQKQSSGQKQGSHSARSASAAPRTASKSTGNKNASARGTASARPAPKKKASYYEEYERYEEAPYRPSSSRRERDYREQEEGGHLMGIVVAVTGVLVLASACVVGYLFLQKNAVTHQMADIALVGEQLMEVDDGGLSVLQSVAREQAAREQEADQAAAEEAARLEEEQRQQEEEQQKAEQEAAEAKKKTQTQKQAQTTAPVLTDTVEFVESTTSDTGSTVEYAEVSKDQVPDPGTKSMAADFNRLTSVTGVDIYSGDTCVTGQAVFVNVGESVTLKAAVYPDNADDQRVEWESVDKSTATIDKNRGIVTGIKADDTIIIARTYDGGYEAKIWVKVRQGLKVTLNHNAATISVGGTAHLEATAEDGGGKVDVTWKNSDSSVAKIDSDGTVTGKKEGKTTITAVSKSSGEVLDTCIVTVSNNGIAVNLNKSKLYLDVGKSEQLKAEVFGTSDTGIRWYSTDSSVASVATNGTVTALKAGVITVIAYSNKDEDSYAYCDVYVGGSSPDPKKDTATKLKDRDGNQLYVKDSKNNYVEATSADYYTHDKFYKRVETKTHKYTGWHNFQGKIYYFDKTGKIITGEQVIQGQRYVFGADGILQEGTPPV